MLAATLFALITPWTSTVVPQKDELKDQFVNPPGWSRPHTWWHWMNGNVTREGITADLEAMKQVGIGGAQMFTVDQGIPKGPAGYMSDTWREMTAHAVREASRLGIELCIHNCAGWSSSGGPWITPENAMQVIGWSKVMVQGPKEFAEVLPPIAAPQVYAKVAYAKDIAVFAFRTPAEGDIPKPNGSFLAKTGVVRGDGIQPDLDPAAQGLEIPAQGVVELTSHLDADGKFTWSVPDGNWTILRMGHVPTGKDNHPAPPEGDGLEVDKLSREALDSHWAGMMAKVIADVGPLAGKVLNNSLIDSYEVGSQNWTPKFREEFQRRRGYDMFRFLPCIAGYTVDSKPITERFLWDFRRTIADLYADNYFGYFGELCHKAGMLFSTEPYGNGGFDNIQAGGTADIPMGEFWVGGGTLETTKLAASIGHTYGRKVVGAESFTADDNRGRWLEEPYGIKALGDLVFCNGINRYIFHRYAAQPWMNFVPGMTMGPWGTHLERTQTWWTEAATWLKYVARCQTMLQQGLFVADALYYYGETAPADLPYSSGLKPRLPASYDYDGCDASLLLKQLRVQNGKFVLPDGMSYRVLVLPETTLMTPWVAKKIDQLVRAGGTVVGPKPTASPTLTNYPSGDTELASVADGLWGAASDEVVDRRVGSGRIISGKALGDVLASMKIAPDFEWKGITGGSKLARIHRKIGNADVYFVSNQAYRPADVECTFRVSGKQPEFWHADTGMTEDAPAFREEGGRTVVPIRFGPAESVFVVFRKPASTVHLASLYHAQSQPQAMKQPTVKITLARYETEDGRGVDVTEIVAQMVKEGTYEIPASNSLFGDPVVNVVKHLRIEFELDGKPVKRVVAENETLTLLEVPSAPVKPAAFSASMVNAGVEIVPWVAGDFVGTWADGKPMKVTAKTGASVQTLGGAWKLDFMPGRGAPPSIDVPVLKSWTESDLPGVKYFSGSATYSKTFDVASSMLGQNRVVMLDLGRVKNFATVELNGKELEVLWKEPFTVDVSSALKPGKNTLRIKVTNLWPNRLIGDEQLAPDVEWDGTHLKAWPDWLVNNQPRPATGRITFTTWKFYNKDSKLLESGLMGPVTIRSARRVFVPAPRKSNNGAALHGGNER